MLNPTKNQRNANEKKDTIFQLNIKIRNLKISNVGKAVQKMVLTP